ncbi:hypothetical protein QZH41_013783 [Actinostola sp. cb2023]|nr:hypothetical protein QZH41_013783 [Actinostola sp. cb2023]
MPPIRKSDLEKVPLSPGPYLSQSMNLATRKPDLENDKLSSSCFSAIRTTKDTDNDLTSLNWLSRNDVLRGFNVGSSVPPMSPSGEGDSDYPNELDSDLSPNGSAVTDGSLNNQKSPSKPPYSFSSLIFMAIEESPSKRLPVKDIYNWIMERFPYFRDARLGWKNSVRHNLSLNKCFKKVDKFKGGVQNVGKGSLWTVDPDYRPNLVQALRKTPSYNAYHHLISTPPPSPQNGSTTHLIINGLNRNRKYSSSTDVDPDAEAEAVATMCLIATPPEIRAAEIVRCQSCPPSAIEEDSLVKRAKAYFYKHRGSFSGLPTMTNDLYRRNFRCGFSASLGSLLEASKLKDCNISPDSSLDGEFEFDHNSESEDENEDSDIEENMKKVIKHDELSDSGCGQGFEEEFDGKNNAKNGSSRRKSRKTKEAKLSDYAGADALLSLANSACSLTSSKEGSQAPSPVVSQSPTCLTASS